MARRQPFEPDPAFEYPLPYRLAQFLLGASGQLEDYTQGLGAQSKGASDVLESEARLDVSRDELRRRREESAAKLASRQQTNQFFQNLGRLGPGGAMEGITDPANMDPTALKFALEQLLPKRYEPPAVAPPGSGILQPGGGYKVEVPETMPATAPPGTGIRQPGGGYKVEVPESMPPTAAPGVGIRQPGGEYKVVIPEPGKRAASLGTAVTGRLRGMNLDPETASAQDIQAAIDWVNSRDLQKSREQGLYGQIAPLMPAEQFGVPGARPGETFAGMKQRVEGEVPKPESAEERAKRISTEASRDIATGIDRMLNDPTYTQYMGSSMGVSASQRLAARRFMGQQGPGVPDKLAELDASIASLQNRISVAMNSARATEQDFSRVLREIPTVDDLPNEAQQKLKVSLRNLEYWEQRAAQASGRTPAPGAAPSAPDTGGLSPAGAAYRKKWGE